jgi:hypothetical protein
MLQINNRTKQNQARGIKNRKRRGLNLRKERGDLWLDLEWRINDKGRGWIWKRRQNHDHRWGKDCFERRRRRSSASTSMVKMRASSLLLLASSSYYSSLPLLLLALGLFSLESTNRGGQRETGRLGERFIGWISLSLSLSLSLFLFLTNVNSQLQRGVVHCLVISLKRHRCFGFFFLFHFICELWRVLFYY